MEYKIVLSDKGKEIYKGGNIEVMKKMLVSFEADNLRKAKKYLNNKLLESIGSSAEFDFKVIEVFK